MEDGTLSSGHLQAINELQEIADANPTALEILRAEPVSDQGLLRISISLGTAGINDDTAAGATGPRATMRTRERFDIFVPHNFPLNHPFVAVSHDRFAHLPHVQWRRFLCLYISSTTEWQPSDGMFGFFDRLLLWIERAATGRLDPAGDPLHPPPVYPSATAGSVVVRVDPPSIPGTAWTGFAVLRQVSNTRVDLVGWLGEDEVKSLLTNVDHDVLAQFKRPDEPGRHLLLGLAVLLAAPTSYEFPTKAHLLIDSLDRQGIPKETLIIQLALLAYLNQRIVVERGIEHSPYVVVGTPMRGIAEGPRQHHLAAWRLSEIGRDLVRLLETLFSTTPDLTEIGVQASRLLRHWLDIADINWARVYEDRTTVTTRRDAGSAMQRIQGQRILVLGCGAIGGHIAEHLVRAGTSRLILVDRAMVSPGVLVRQPYDDADIDRPKAEALAHRLQRIRPDVDVQIVVSDALASVLGEDSKFCDVDLIIDAAANPAVTIALERHRRSRVGRMPPILSFVVGHTAHRGIVTIASTNYTGGGVDLMRRVKLATLSDPRLRVFADDFFPHPPRADHFQPEPGCSEATFVGSDAEVAALTATMLVKAIARCTASSTESAGTAILVDLGLDEQSSALTQQLHWPADYVTIDPATGFDVRISGAVLSEMRAECRVMARRRSDAVETGGMLLGEIDDACGVVWVDMASSPPPDSRASAQAFVCGVEGVGKLITHHDCASRGALRFIGMWHSHPAGKALPSMTDDEGMRELVVPVSQGPRRALLLIVGGSLESWNTWLLGEHESETVTPPQIFARISHRPLARELQDAVTDSATYKQALEDAGPMETRRWPPKIVHTRAGSWPWRLFRWR